MRAGVHGGEDRAGGVTDQVDPVDAERGAEPVQVIDGPGEGDSLRIAERGSAAAARWS